jgi:superfamily II DNA or RNA helicase
VRARIATAWLARDEVSRSVGGFTLQPSQRRAVQAITRAMKDFGGAMLADPPGTGKTVIALAVADALTRNATHPSRSAGADRVLVIAPATLRAQWMVSAARAECPIGFASFESLSRGASVGTAALVIVDEAHHARTPTTRRYHRLAALCAGARVLLLTATPIVNGRHDLHALLALFLGARSASLDAEHLARVMVRRTATPEHHLPNTHRLPALDVPECPVDIAAALAALPPPLPAADGTAALALIRMTLAMAWGSSLAALDAALRRRLQRTDALRDALRDGRWPSRRALAQWIIGDDATQLAWPLLLTSTEDTPPPDALTALDAHRDAVAAVRRAVRPHVEADSAARALHLRRLMDTHPNRRVAVFARHTETIVALWRELRFMPGAVAVTGGRVRAAEGRWSREEILRALGPRAHPWRPDDPRGIRLLLTTDLLSEGVELQGVEIIVHGDGAWNPARFEQRTGRITRIGSAAEVHETHFAMPRGAEEFTALAARLRRKSRARDHAVREAWEREQLEARLTSWTAVAPRGNIACATSVIAGFLALIRLGETLTLVGGRRRRGRWHLATTPNQLRHFAACAEGEARPVSPQRVRQVRSVLGRWGAQRMGRALLDFGAHHDAVTRAARAQVDRLIDRTPLSARAAVATEATDALTALGRAKGIGTEHALRHVLRQAGNRIPHSSLTPDAPEKEREPGALARLLELAHDVSSREASHGATGKPERDAGRTNGEPSLAPRPRLLALLLLEPADLVLTSPAVTPRRATPAGAPAPVPPVAGPESAATR